MTLPDLSPLLKDALAARGYSLKMAAVQLGVTEANIRQWFSRNRFPREKLPPLAQLASMPAGVDELAKLYKFGLSSPKRDAVRIVPANVGTEQQKFSLGQTVKFLDQRLEALDPSGQLYDNFGQDVESVFRAIGKDDVFVFWSIDQLPFEMLPENSGFRREVARGVLSGAYFVYLYPGADLLKDLEEKSGIGVLPAKDLFVKTFAKFVTALTLEDAFKSETAKEKVPQQVVKFPASGPAFASPSHRFALFFPSSHAGPRGFARFPTGNDKRSKELHLSLNSTVTGQLLDFVRKSLRDAKDQEVPSRDELLKLVG
jgi:hypothetical protein